jgi:hypothetical protein
MAALMAHMTNLARSMAGDRRTAKASDFLPKKPQSAAQQKAFFKSLTERLNG